MCKNKRGCNDGSEQLSSAEQRATGTGTGTVAKATVADLDDKRGISSTKQGKALYRTRRLDLV
jgi:hypothetical protein